MVSINFTFFVLLGMFLVFLGAMNRFVLRPLLKVMDERDRQFQEDRDEARALSKGAVATEQDFASKIAALHREAQNRIAKSHRAAQEDHQSKLEALKKREVEEMRHARKEANELLKLERAQFPALTGQIRTRIRTQLGLEGEAS